ncbi:unnamed protein product, partial [Polarella glacialis]
MKPLAASPFGCPLQGSLGSEALPAPQTSTSTGLFQAKECKDALRPEKRVRFGMPSPTSQNLSSSWGRSAVPYDTSHSELFPLPQFGGDVVPATGSRSSKQRKLRRTAVAADVSSAISALNHTYGVSDSDFVSSRNGEPVLPSAAQLNVHRRLLSIVSADRPDSVPPPREAFHGLLGERADDYFASGTPVLPYSPADFALAGCENPISLESLMAPSASKVLSPLLLLQQLNVRDQTLKDSSVALYFDDVLKKDRRAYVDFIGRLRAARMVCVRGQRRERITPFFIGKKGKSTLRLLLDCRHSNMHFVPPPKTDMGLADALIRMELKDGDELYIAQADVLNCYCQISLPLWLVEYFGLDPLTHEECLLAGFPASELAGLRDFFPCMSVLPMGWAWSFWLVQHIHENICDQQSFPVGRRIVASWPVPALDGALALPYCDNLSVLGTSAAEVQAGLDVMCAGFTKAGFKLHDITGAERCATMLGASSDGVRGTVRGKPVKAWALKQAFIHVANARRVSGKQIEILLGLYVPHALFARSGLSVPRALYSFIRAHYESPVPLRPSAAFECMVIAGLLPILSANLRRPWSAIVTATDASEGGQGIVQRQLDLEAVTSMGRWG